MIKKILVGIPPKNHVNLAMDEVLGLTELDYICDTIVYTRNKPFAGKLDKLFGVIRNAFNLVLKLYSFKPDLVYLNSRFEKVGTTRDFLTVFIIRLLYWKKLDIAIKTHGSNFKILTEKSFFFHSVVMPYLSREVNLWFFLSQEEKNKLTELAPKFARKVYVTGNIIDPKRSIKSELFMKEQGLSDGRFKFFFAGRMVAAKGIFTILKAIPNFKYKEECVFIFL